jgi:hypothetical protein
VRTGCGCGCLVVVLAGLLAVGVFWLGSGMFDRPSIQYEIGGPADGKRAQQKLFELTTGGTRGRAAAVTFTERELNALLVRHLTIEEMPLADMGVRLLGNGVVELTGRLPLHALPGDSLGAVVRILPERWSGRPVWLRVRGQVRLEMGAARGDRRTLRLDPESLWIGRRWLPTVVLMLLPEGPAARATRWPLPDAVDSVVVEPGRVTITLRS